MVKYFFFFVFSFAISTVCSSQEQKVKVEKTTSGFTLRINGKKFFITGMNWDYYPIGTNYKYSLWQQPTATIKEELDYEMPLLKNMGVNTIRQYSVIPPE